MEENRGKQEEPDKEPELQEVLNNENQAPQDHRETIKVREMSDVKLEDGKEKEIVEQEQIKEESDKKSDSSSHKEKKSSQSDEGLEASQPNPPIVGITEEADKNEEAEEIPEADIEQDGQNEQVFDASPEINDQGD